ncbi:MAG TPA: GNAT family N-acetyltransferase [Sphingomicrobium sp.]|nr:GNAT family N-acetyltransferase [Sphingomicrobium sp.]
MDKFSHRVAIPGDLDALREVMRRSIEALQVDYLTAEQVKASHHVMGLDSQLIRDGTYFIVESGHRIAGCGGWSWRSTLYGGDKSLVEREPRTLDARTEPARIRAMYTDPDFVRRGVGRLILKLCEEAAVCAGYRSATMMATMAGVPLYEACGYVAVESILSGPINGVRVPLVRMEKALT